MKSKIISACAVMALFMFTASGCTDKNDNSVSELSDSSVTVTTEYTSVSEEVTSAAVTSAAVTSSSKAESVPYVKVTERSYIQNPEKKLFSEIDISRPFYGFENKDSVHIRGTGPEKPSSVNRLKYMYYIHDASIKDTVLKSLVSDFIEKSKQDILSDFNKYYMFYCNDPEKSKLSMEFTEQIDIINNYCFVTVRYREKKSSNPVFEARCGYFDIREKKQIEFSDMFYRDSDFMRGVYENLIDGVTFNWMYKVELEDDLKPGFNGLCNEMLLMYPYLDYYTYSQISDLQEGDISTSIIMMSLICPRINPYGHYSASMSAYDICHNSVILNNPEYIPEDIAEGCIRVFFNSSSCSDAVRYGVYNKDTRFTCPVECDFLSNDEISSLMNRISREIPEKYAEHIDREDDLSVSVSYDSDIDGFSVISCKSSMHLGTDYYRMDTHEKYTFEEICRAYIGDDWERLPTKNSFDRDSTNIFLDKRDNSSGKTKVHTRTVYCDGRPVVSADFKLNDEGVWVRTDSTEEN